MPLVFFRAALSSPVFGFTKVFFHPRFYRGFISTPKGTNEKHSPCVGAFRFLFVDEDLKHERHRATVRWTVVTASDQTPAGVRVKSSPRNQQCEPKKISVRKTPKLQRFRGFVFMPFFKL